MKLEIKKIQLSELESFINSETFKEFDTIPISKLRVASYLNNPAAHSDDFILYLGFIDKQLVAFRTILAGELNANSDHDRFGWCSGNWVHPNHRRKGFSERLLMEALYDWNNQLMFTNYAPNSESLYIKTGKFQAIHQFHGIRGYLFLKTKRLLPCATKNVVFRILFAFIDALISIITKARVIIYNPKTDPDVRFELLPFPDKTCLQFAEQNQSKLFFKRGKDEFNWIFQYPWMTKNKDDYSAKYPFSSFSEDFSYQTVKIFRNEKFCGFFILSIKNKQLKTLFFEIESKLNEAIAEFIKNYFIQKKLEGLTVYNSGIANALFKRKFPFLYVKKYGQKIYSSFNVQTIQPNIFQDGDGDVIFT